VRLLFIIGVVSGFESKEVLSLRRWGFIGDFSCANGFI